MLVTTFQITKLRCLGGNAYEGIIENIDESLFENFQIALLVFSTDLKVLARDKQERKKKMDVNNE